jgi:N-acetylmuramoyl-L-alanine amidase
MFVSLPSPNFNDRAPQIPLRFVVLHYTGMQSAKEALDRLTDSKAEVSAHYVVDEDGDVYGLVDEAKRAWHAGKSFWQGIEDVNSASIGIELVNPGHEFGYGPFREKQLEALSGLLGEVFERNAIDLHHLLAHADVAPLRRADPGELFPWEAFAEKGFGFWPSPRPDDRLPLAIGRAQLLLRAIGYDCPDNGEGDSATSAAITAFQRHYCPESLFQADAGQDLLDIETCARLRALARLVVGEAKE